MAGAEVTVSSGDLMAVKEEEGESSGNNHKTQVILHLQPILHGMNDDIMSTGTTLLAIEAHHDDSKAEGEEVEYGYPITCGDSRAVLLFKKFVCPGINVRCVKFNDQLISPKQFVHLAGKATLKDWKRAIRLGGVMLRKMMDSGQIDFYQHDSVCSNTCRSTKFDVLIHSSRLPPGASLQPSPSSLALDPPGGQVPLLTDIVHDAEVEEDLRERFGAAAAAAAAAEWPARLLNPATANGHAAKRKRADTPVGVLGLWKGVADSGLMGEVLSSLQTELLTTLKGVELRSEKANLQETDAVILNSLCEMFGLLDSVKQALDLRRSHMDQSKLHERAYVLDEIMEERRKHGGNKSSSAKVLRRQRHNLHNNQTHNVLSPVKTLIQPLAASYGHLFGYFPASAGQHHPSKAGGTDRDRSHELGGTRSQEEEEEEKVEGEENQDISGINKESGLRTGRCREDLHLRGQEEEETEGLHKAEKVITGRKSLKKHKSK